MGNKTIDPYKTGELLAALRKSKGYTQLDVAQLLGISNKSISKWERGDGMPDIGMLPLLADLYEISVDEILAGERIRSEEMAAKSSMDKTSRRIEWLLHQKTSSFTNLSIFLATLLFGSTLTYYCIVILLASTYADLVLPIAFLSYSFVLLVGLCIEIICYRNYRNSVICFESDTEHTDVLLSYIKKIRATFYYILHSFITIAILSLPLCLCKETVHVSIVSTSQFSIRCYFYLLPKLILLAVLINMVIHAFLSHYCFHTPKQLPRKSLFVLIFSLALLAGFAALETGLPPRALTQTLSQDEFHDFVSRYLTIYNGYRLQYGSADASSDTVWPELSYGIQETNPNLLDPVLRSSKRYDSFRNVTGFDYDTYTVIRRPSSEEYSIQRMHSFLFFLPLYCILLILNLYQLKPVFLRIHQN